MGRKWAGEGGRLRRRRGEASSPMSNWGGSRTSKKYEPELFRKGYWKVKRVVGRMQTEEDPREKTQLSSDGCDAI